MDLLMLSQDAMATAELEVGGFVRLHNGQEGTIRHLGAVHFSPGDFVGVELLVPSRGAHDGSVGEVTYFPARPHTAVFVRPSDVESFRRPPSGADSVVPSSIAAGSEPPQPQLQQYPLRPAAAGGKRGGPTGSMWSRHVQQQRADAAAAATVSSFAAVSATPAAETSWDGSGDMSVEGGGSISLKAHAAEVARYEARIAELSHALQGLSRSRTARVALDSGSGGLLARGGVGHGRGGVRGRAFAAAAAKGGAVSITPRGASAESVAVRSRVDVSGTASLQPPVSSMTAELAPTAVDASATPVVPHSQVLPAGEDEGPLDVAQLLLSVGSAGGGAQDVELLVSAAPAHSSLEASAGHSLLVSRHAAAGPASSSASALGNALVARGPRSSFTWWSGHASGGRAEPARGAAYRSNVEATPLQGRASKADASRGRAFAAAPSTGMRSFVARQQEQTRQPEGRVIDPKARSPPALAALAGRPSSASAALQLVLPSSPPSLQRSAVAKVEPFLSPGFAPAVPPPEVAVVVGREGSSVVVGHDSAPPPAISPRSGGSPTSLLPRPLWRRPQSSHALPSPPTASASPSRGSRSSHRHQEGPNASRSSSSTFRKRRLAGACDLSHAPPEPPPRQFSAASFLALARQRVSSVPPQTPSGLLRRHRAPSSSAELPLPAASTSNGSLQEPGPSPPVSASDATSSVVARLRKDYASALAAVGAPHSTTVSAAECRVSAMAAASPLLALREDSEDSVQSVRAHVLQAKGSPLAPPRPHLMHKVSPAVLRRAPIEGVAAPAPPIRRRPPPPPAVLAASQALESAGITSAADAGTSLRIDMSGVSTEATEVRGASPPPAAGLNSLLAAAPSSVPLTPMQAAPLEGTKLAETPKLTRAVAFVRAYAGICEQGFTPSNPDKPCQDAIRLEEHAASDAVVLAVFDGHGVDGRAVAEHFSASLTTALFASRHYYEWVAVTDNIPAPGSDEEAVEVTAALARAAAANPQQQASPRRATPLSPSVGRARLRRNVGAALCEALLTCEASLLARSDIDCSLAGTTACVAVVCDGDHLTVANVGDSRAMLVRRWQPLSAGGGGDDPPQLVAVGVSIDHKPTLPSELRRILLSGGRVAALTYQDGGVGPVRVWLRDEDSPGLAMSRSLGDTCGKRAGVSSAPEVFTGTLQPGSDCFLVVASDGLWEFLSGQDVAETLLRTHAQAAAAAASHAAAESAGHAGSDAPPPAQQHLQLALDSLANEAVQRWQTHEGCVDDLSVVIAEIGTSCV